MCELLVGLPSVTVLGVVGPSGEALRIHIETRRSAPVGCPTCGVVAKVKDRPRVALVDLAAFGRPARLVWHKVRWRCVEPDCAVGSWTEEDRRIAAPRMAMTDRAARWVTEQVGRCARSVSGIARELGCDWHTVNDAIVAYGEALVDEPRRYGDVAALGLDEVLFVRRGKFHELEFSTSIADVEAGQLLDIVAGRKTKGSIEWLEKKGDDWRNNVRYGTLDMSGSYRAVFDKMLPHATQVADPFHVVKWANEKLDECRRRVQDETLGHRGLKSDPLYRCRKLLTKADERLDDKGREKLLGLLQAGDPRGDVTTTWHAKEAVRSLYVHTDEATAREWIDRLIDDMADTDNPVEVRSLSKTLKRWKEHIVAWHRCQMSNGPTEAVNNLIKRVKRAAFGFTSFRNYRVRALLYSGKPRWALLATITPR
ncbi:MAG: ISL3 family transposase [Acidimicrobiales bacterium]